MEHWERDFEWLQLRHKIAESFGKEGLPDLNAVLYLIGIQEFGNPARTYSKEEKQDLMHIATCKLMSFDGYYELEGTDEEGWPHYVKTKKIRISGTENQESYLIEKVIQYFNTNETENINANEN